MARSRSWSAGIAHSNLFGKSPGRWVRYLAISSRRLANRHAWRLKYNPPNTAFVPNTPSVGTATLYQILHRAGWP